MCVCKITTIRNCEKEVQRRSQCPYDCGNVETPMHFLDCSDPRARHYKKQRLRKLRKYLEVKGVYEGITSTFIYCLRHEPGHIPYIPPMNTLEKNLNNAMTDQLTIGWTEFRRGFISLQWERLQIAYDDHKGIPAAERNDWGKVFVKAILDYAYDLWKMRNQALHGNTLQESKQK